MAKQPAIDGGYIVIPKNTINSNQYKALKAHTRVVYTAILTKFIRHNKLNPTNSVKITHNQMEAISAVGHSSVVRAIKELKQKDFLRVIVPGGLEGNPNTFQLNGRFTDSGNEGANW